MDALKIRRLLEREGARFPIAHPTLMITFRTRGGRHDWDNLIASFKSGLDGIVDAGIIADDSATVVAELRLRWEQGKPYGVRVDVGSDGEM